MLSVLVLGAGGHAKVVADILMRACDTGERIRPIGYLDDSPTAQGQTLLGLPVLGRIADLEHIAHDALVIAIGDNRVRQALFDRLRSQGERFVPAVHPGAIIARDVRIGTGTVIGAGAVVGPGSVIGDNVILNTSCSVDHDNRVGNHAHVAPGAHLGGDAEIGGGALVGLGAIVLPRLRVGDWSIVGAGAVVTKDVPPHATVLGVPARVVRVSACREAS